MKGANSNQIDLENQTNAPCKVLRGLLTATKAMDLGVAGSSPVGYLRMPVVQLARTPGATNAVRTVTEAAATATKLVKLGSIPGSSLSGVREVGHSKQLTSRGNRNTPVARVLGGREDAFQPVKNGPAPVSTGAIRRDVHAEGPVTSKILLETQQQPNTHCHRRPKGRPSPGFLARQCPERRHDGALVEGSGKPTPPVRSFHSYPKHVEHHAGCLQDGGSTPPGSTKHVRSRNWRGVEGHAAGRNVARATRARVRARWSAQPHARPVGAFGVRVPTAGIKPGHQFLEPHSRVGCVQQNNDGLNPYHDDKSSL